MDTSSKEKRERAYKIFEILKEEHPDARPLLNYENAFELLIATILAAQCTDERVNMVTPVLFKKYSGPARLAKAEQGTVEEIIRSTGFYKNKAKSLREASKAIVQRFGGELPRSIDELATLPGVGRKTANVVAGNCFGIPAIIVDTHLKRVTARLGLVESSDPDKIEAELRALIDEGDQTRFSHVINYHGRYTCKAPKPLCWKCRVEKLCPYPDKNL